MSAHSPGPWRWEAWDEGDVLLDPDGDPVVTGEFTCSAANARLIAAAPELLAALTDAVDCADDGAGARRECWMALIRRIEGGE